ncbi:MAG: SusD/RagB family nutrient-binding outer membrane lipoprotein, partial [Bacteroidota bacterium]
NNSVILKETQLSALPQVRWVNYSIGTEEIWSNYYRSMPNIRELESRWSGEDTASHEVNNMRAMLKIVLAYKTFKITDLFGDVPFSEAGYGYQDPSKLRPRFDSQESIYRFLLAELEWADRNIDPSAVDTEPFRTFKTFDHLFNGDMVKWRKFANSIRLRQAMRLSDKNVFPDFAKATVEDILLNNRPCFGVDQFGFLVNQPYAESALMFPYQLGYRNESRGWSFDQSKDVRLGSTFWQLVSSSDDSTGVSIFDPRAYYFYETNVDNFWRAFPNAPSVTMAPDGGDPYNYQRDVAYSLKGAGCRYSPVNYYTARDMDYIPEILFSGAEVLFLRAEACQRATELGISVDPNLAATELLNALQFSLTFWESIMGNSKLPVGTPFAANIAVPSSVNFISLQNNIGYFSASPSRQLEIIYAQSWIDFFLQPQHAFALSRRTGKTPHAGTPSSVYRFPIPPTEVSYNGMNWSSVFSSGDAMGLPLWWMQ